MLVILPTNRAINLNYLAPLIDHGARFIVVDDSEGSIHVDHPQFEVYNWGDRARMLGAMDIGYPRRNGACRDFGFYVAWKNSDPGEIIVALDDDCAVYHADFYERVNEVLSLHPRPVVTCAGTHLNVLNLYEGVSADLFPRGFPYSARVNDNDVTFNPPESRKVTFSLGLWKGIFDVNAIDKIKGPNYQHPEATLRHDSVIIERHKLVSVCSMSMQFRRELIPAAYQLPMHIEVMPNWVIDRYGDIWGGFILKILMDLKGEAMSAGEPMIYHLKEGDHMRNIWQEHVCHLVNDEFIDLLLDVKTTLHSASYLDMMNQLLDGLRTRIDGASPILKPYLRHLSTAMEAWSQSLA